MCLVEANFGKKDWMNCTVKVHFSFLWDRPVKGIVSCAGQAGGGGDQRESVQGGGREGQG